MVHSTPDLCPCSSGMAYSQCCQPFHKGLPPENALQLMRSRYVAYVLNLPEYIIKTTHPGNPEYSENRPAWKERLSDFSHSFQFLRLDVLDFKERGQLATVLFKAHLMLKEQDASFTEKSYFEKWKGRWLYRGCQLVEGHEPNLITTDQLRLLPLAYYGDPVLRKKAAPINAITEDVVRLAEEMVETMNACDGWGLAAPQVHHSVRLFVMRLPIEKGEELELGEAVVFINPKLSAFSQETLRAPEGCLSIPTLRADVDRSREIMVEYTDLEGKTTKKLFTGWAARVIMHENDHLDGVLFIDRLSKEERSLLEPSLQNLKKRLHDGVEL
jgi:peptide deformylase